MTNSIKTKGMYKNRTQWRFNSCKSHCDYEHITYPVSLRLQSSTSINQSISQYFIEHPKVGQRAGQLSLQHVQITKARKK